MRTVFLPFFPMELGTICNKQEFFRLIQHAIIIMEELKEALARSESARLKVEEENHLLKGRLEQGEREKRDLFNKYMAEISKR